MKSPRNLPLNDAWVIWFMLGVIMLNYPFLHIFNKTTPVFGIPLAILYFFVGWPISIFVIYLFSIYQERHTEPETSEDPQEPAPPGDDS